MDLINILLALICFFVGVGSYYTIHRIRLGRFRAIAEKVIYQAEKRAEEIQHSAEFSLKEKQITQTKELECVWQSEKRKFQREEERLQQREDKLESRMNLVEKKLSDIEKKEAILAGRKTQLDEERKKV